MSLALLAPPARPRLLSASFRADIAAPLPSPLQLDLGTFTVTDASNIMGQANGQLAVVGTAGATSGAISAAGYARTNGLALLWAARRSANSGSSKIGFQLAGAIAATLQHGWDFSGGSNVRVNEAGATLAVNEPAAATQYAEMGVILRSTGWFGVVREEPWGSWTLGWVSNVGTGAVYPAIVAAAAAHGFTVRNMRLVQLAGPWASDYGPAVVRSAVTANGDTLNGCNFGIFEHTITAATGVTQEFSFRYATDNDRWLVRLNQATGAVQLIEVVAGVETVRGTGTATLTQTNGTAYRVVVVVRPGGGTNTVVTVCTQTGAAAAVFKDTFTGAASGPNAIGLKVSHAGANLCAWPRGVPLPEAA